MSEIAPVVRFDPPLPSRIPSPETAPQLVQVARVKVAPGAMLTGPPKPALLSVKLLVMFNCTPGKLERSGKVTAPPKWKTTPVTLFGTRAPETTILGVVALLLKKYACAPFASVILPDWVSSISPLPSLKGIQ